MTTRPLQLLDLAHARSGDKGDTANVGVIAYVPEHYGLLERALTPERVKAHFGDMVGRVERFELPNLHALNFLLHHALDGGGTVSLMNDAQGKVLSTALLRMVIDVPEEIADAMEGRGRPPERAGRPREERGRSTKGQGSSGGAARSPEPTEAEPAPGKGET